MKDKTGSLGEGSSSPLLPMFRASVASAPPNFLSASWLTNTNRGASRSSLSTIDSEEIREKDGSPEKNSDSTKEGSRSKRRKNLWKSGVEGQWHSLEALSRILGIMSLVCFSVGAGLTIVGFASRGLPVNASLLFQILGPVLLAAAFVTFLLGSVLGRLWKGEWQKRQQEMETLVRMKLEKLTKEILLQQHQQRLLTFPQQQFMSSESRSMLESIPLDVEAGVSKIAKRSRFFSRPGSLLNVSSSTETTTANSRRSSRLVNNNGSCSQVDQAIEGLSSALVRRDLERLGTGVLPTRKNNNFPSFDLPGIQISRIETLDLDQASGSSCCSAKRYIIVHSDVASSDFSFASEYSLLSTARSKSRSRSSNASLFDFSPRDSEWDADVSLGSRDSQTSITGRSSISGREYPVGFSKQYYSFHRASCGQPQQHLLLLPPGAKNLSGASNGASIDECPSSPRRHSSPVSQNYKRVGLGGGDRMDESFFPSDFDSNQSFASRLNLATRHPYSSCSPLLLKPSSGNNNDFSASNGGSGVSEATASTKGSESLDQSITRSQLFFQQFKYPQPMRKFSYEEQRRISWLRKRSYGDQSVISMKITEDSDDEAAEERDSFEASRPAIDDGDKTGKSEVVIQTTSQGDDKDTRHQMLKLTTKSGESVQLTQEDSTSQVQRTDSNEEKSQVAQIVEAQVDPRWRHFFDGSTSMAMVAAATVSSVVDKKRACLKRNTTDDSEVERRVAKLLKEIEFSATDSVEDCSKTTRDGVLSTRPILNFFPYDSKSSDGTTSLSLRARRDSFASKGRQQQTTSSSSSSQPFSFFASRQLSLHPPSRGIEVQTQTDEGLDRPKSPEVPEKEKSPTRKPEKRRTSKLIQNTSTESSSGVSIQNASSNAVQPEQTLSGGASKLKFFAKALPQVIAAATSAAAMECNRLVSAKNFAAKKRKRKQKSGNSEDAGGKS